MSEHGRSSRGDVAAAAEFLDPKWISRHRGTRDEYLARYRKQAKTAVTLGREGVDKLAPSLLYFISDERTLRAAWAYLQEHAGQAPGPDGETYDDCNESEKWQCCRAIRDTIRAGEYEPGPERIHKIPKGPGRGFRPLILQSIFDCIVQRAAVEILQPLLDPHFDDYSFGYRPKPRRSTLHALALAERYFAEQQHRSWVVVDVRDAFQHVPLPRLLDVVRKHFPIEDIVAFIGRVLSKAKTPGLRQGGPLSPLLLNLFLDHFLDRKWRKLHPDIPLIRWADDILLLCRTDKQANQAYGDLTRLLREAGMSLKEDCAAAVCRLTPERPVQWMGFRIGQGQDGLRVTVTGDAWDSLGENLALAHQEPNSPLRAFRSICGWISQKGPCYPFVTHDKAYARLADLARAQAFDEIPDRSDARQLWQKAYARWCRVRQDMATKPLLGTGAKA